MFTTLERAKVWNHGTKEHVEEFNGQVIKIPAQGFIEMEFKEAVLFKSQFYRLVKNSANGQEVQNKPLSLEKFLVRVPTESAQAPKDIDTMFRCMACQKPKDFSSEAEYTEHVEEKHMHQLVDKQAKEKISKAN